MRVVAAPSLPLMAAFLPHTTQCTASPLRHRPLKSLNVNDAAGVLEQVGHQSCLVQDRFVFAAFLQETKAYEWVAEWLQGIPFPVAHLAAACWVQPPRHAAHPTVGCPVDRRVSGTSGKQRSGLDANITEYDKSKERLLAKLADFSAADVAWKDLSVIPFGVPASQTLEASKRCRRACNRRKHCVAFSNI